MIWINIKIISALFPVSKPTPNRDRAGLGQHPDSVKALEQLLQVVEKPLVIDADALNLIAANKDLLKRIPPRSILTPHPKEFDRIAGESTNSYERLKKAQAFATDHQLCVVLKGAYTAICTATGNVYFNNCGNPGMATAGSGDVLTGIILALLAQGIRARNGSRFRCFPSRDSR